MPKSAILFLPHSAFFSIQPGGFLELVNSNPTLSELIITPEDEIGKLGPRPHFTFTHMEGKKELVCRPNKLQGICTFASQQFSSRFCLLVTVGMGVEESW